MRCRELSEEDDGMTKKSEREVAGAPKGLMGLSSDLGTQK